MTLDDCDKLKQFLSTYRHGQCLLFVGAGFSVGAERTTNEGYSENIPAGRDLTRIMADDLGEDSTNLSDVAEAYVEKRGKNGLFSLLNSLYVASSVTTTQQKIASYAWKEVYTTNYDNVIELSFGSVGKGYSVYSPSSKPSEVNYKTVPIIHINGSIAGASFNTFMQEVKLTDYQYVSDDFSKSVWGERFRSNLLISPCIVFAGYSMYDIDVVRIIHDFEGMKDRIFFILGDSPAPSLLRKLERFGAVLPIGTVGLARLIDEVAKEPETGGGVSVTAWDQVTLPAVPPHRVRDLDVVNFLMAGSYDDRLFAGDIISKNNRLSIERSASESIVKLLDGGSLRHAIVTSNIGNGKTTILDAVAVRLAARNFTVFKSSGVAGLTLRDVPLFKDMAGRIPLIIENGFSNYDLTRAIIALGRNDIHIITSARTSQFELQESQIRTVFEDEVENFDVNVLDAQEVSSLIDFLDIYALWGDRQALGRDKKERFVRVECSSELRFVILDILDSPNIRSRIQSIMNFDGNSTSRDQIRSILALSQFLNLAQTKPDLATIGELVGYDARRAIAKHSDSLRDFSLIKNGTISIRSSIFAEYVLRKLIETSFSMETLISSMRRLDVLHDNDKKYQNLFQNFSRFRFVESGIAPEKRLVHMVNYFETIKVLSHAKEHSLFWLQYAMCRLSLDQFREAERLFDVAFSYSRKAGFSENRHLNNQYARFLLESRTKTNEYSDYIQAFNKAHAICIKQLQDEPASHNPYRVVENYKSFVERRLPDLEVGDITNIVRSCAEVVRAATKNRAEIGNTKFVEGTLVSIDQAVALCKAALRSKGYQI